MVAITPAGLERLNAWLERPTTARTELTSGCCSCSSWIWPPREPAIIEEAHHNVAPRQCSTVSSPEAEAPAPHPALVIQAPATGNS